jgi:RNA polymerase sigma-70 factor (sigma-E family)
MGEATVRAEDEAAFTAFVYASSSSLLSTAYALTRDRQLAEDLLQTALARCYLAWSRIRSEDPEAYVRRTLVNSQRNAWRRRLPSLTWRAEVPDDRGSPPFDDQLVERQTLLDAVASLSPQQRAVLVLRYYEDRSDGEIAVLLGCGVGSVKRHASRGLRRLQQHATVREMSPDRALRQRTAP